MVEAIIVLFRLTKFHSSPVPFLKSDNRFKKLSYFCFLSYFKADHFMALLIDFPTSPWAALPPNDHLLQNTQDPCTSNLIPTRISCFRNADRFVIIATEN